MINWGVFDENSRFHSENSIVFFVNAPALARGQASRSGPLCTTERKWRRPCAFTRHPASLPCKNGRPQKAPCLRQRVNSQGNLIDPSAITLSPSHKKTLAPSVWVQGLGYVWSLPSFMVWVVVFPELQVGKFNGLLGGRHGGRRGRLWNMVRLRLRQSFRLRLGLRSWLRGGLLRGQQRRLLRRADHLL